MRALSMVLRKGYVILELTIYYTFDIHNKRTYNKNQQQSFLDFEPFKFRKMLFLL